MTETREQWLTKSPCAGCSGLAWDENYGGNGPIFSCSREKNTEIFELALDGVKKDGVIVYRACSQCGKASGH